MREFFAGKTASARYVAALAVGGTVVLAAVVLAVSSPARAEKRDEIHPTSWTGIAPANLKTPRPEPSPMVRSNGLDLDVAADIGRVLETLKKYRGLELKEPVDAKKTKTEELLAYVNKNMQDPAAMRQLRVAEAFFRTLGAIPADCDLADVMRSYLVEEIAGLYDWKDKTLYMAERVYGDLRTLTLSHELTHALQDQYFGLNRFMDVKDGVSEPFAAAQTLMEGDATLSMLQARTGTVPNGVVAEFMVRSLMQVLDMGDRMKELKVPPAIAELLMFPYVAGFRFTVAVINGGKNAWRDVDWMYANPPLSTEQVMHPEKAAWPDGRAGTDWPRDVTIPGADAMVAGAAFSGTDIAGEGNLASIFRDAIGTDDGDKAAAGWDGDRFIVWRDGAGQPGMLLASVWDTAADAVQAADAFGKTRVKPVAVKVSGDRVVVAWGAAVKNPEILVASIADTMTTREIHAWSDWFSK